MSNNIQETITDSIFDHEITKLELEILSSCSPKKGLDDKEKYLKYCDTDTLNADLYMLFILRDQMDIAETYLKRIKESNNISSIYFF